MPRLSGACSAHISCRSPPATEGPDEQQHLGVAGRVGAAVQVQRGLAARRVRVRRRIGVGERQEHRRMVGPVAAHAGQVDAHVDAGGAQVVGRADAGAQQQQRSGRPRRRPAPPRRPSPPARRAARRRGPGRRRRAPGPPARRRARCSSAGRRPGRPVAAPIRTPSIALRRDQPGTRRGPPAFLSGSAGKPEPVGGRQQPRRPRGAARRRPAGGPGPARAVPCVGPLQVEVASPSAT